jgi:hypothetical protein
MEIEGIQTYKVVAVGHGWGIAEGVRQLPQLLLKESILPSFISVIFWAVLLFSIYHLVRDLLQAFNLDSVFTNIGHRSHQWCGSYCDVLTIPFDVLGVIISAIVLKRGRGGRLGLILMATLPLLVIFALLP